jgi:hypothetical protein
MPEPPALTPTNVERLRLLQRRHEQLFELRQPLTAALVVALAEDADALRARDPKFEPEEAISGIQAVAEAMVRKAMNGDTNAFAQIADRVEGKVGTRKGESDEELSRHAQVVEATIEGVVEAMTRRRTEQQPALAAPLDQQPDPQPVVVDVEPVQPRNDAQQSDR